MDLINNPSILDLNGFMFSGKSAVSDLIREFEGIASPNYNVEFDLIRTPHGLGDLMSAFQSSSLIATDHALRSYRKLASTIALPPRGLKKLVSYGGNYEETYPGFLSKTDKFLGEITMQKWDIKWPYNSNEARPLQIFKSKFISKLDQSINWPVVNFNLANFDRFSSSSKNYLSSLLIGKDENNLRWKITHNALEPYRPSQFFPLFHKVKAIIVERDIRDIYLTSTSFSSKFNSDVSIYSRISGAHDINIFIERQKAMHTLRNDSHPDVLYIKFEELINNYDSSRLRLLNFLDMSINNHISPFLYFNPDVSRKNTGLWKSATKSQMAAINKLEEALPNLCFS